MTNREQEKRTGAELIAAERARQIAWIDGEGWSEGHDDEHTNGELVAAAICYAAQPGGLESIGITDSIWPWEPEAWKPTPGDRIRELTKAGALLAAEIDRLQRLEAPMTNRAEETEREMQRYGLIPTFNGSVTLAADPQGDLVRYDDHRSSIQEVVDELRRRAKQERQSAAGGKAEADYLSEGAAQGLYEAADLLRERCLGGEEG